MAWKLPANVIDLYTRFADEGEIPAGTFRVGRALPTQIKPNGFTHTNVTTLRYTAGFMSAVLAFGQNGTSGASVNSSILNFGSAIDCGALADRDATTISQASGANALGYYALTDTTTSVGTQGTAHVKGELVYGSGASTTFTFGRLATRIVGGGVGQGSTYADTAILIPIDAYASYNVSISNLTIDGNGIYPARLFVACFVDNLTLTDCNFYDFHHDGTYTIFCRNILRLRCHVDGSDANEGGEGRCHADNRVFNTESRDCTYGGSGNSSRGPRHAHTTEYGVSNKLMDGGRADDTYNPSAKDTPFWEAASHVGPDNDCKMIDCRHNEGAVGGGIGMGGHQLFGYGSTGVVITDCDANGHDLFLAMDSTGTYTNIGNARYFWIIGCGDRTGAGGGVNPSHATGPGNCTFTNVDFEYGVTGVFSNNAGDAGTYGLANWSGLLDFVGITVNGTETDKPAFNLASSLDCSIKFRDGCDITGNGDTYQVIELNCVANTLTVAGVASSTFTQNGGTSGQGAFGTAGSGVVTPGSVTGNTWNYDGVRDFMQGTFSNLVTDPSP